MMKKKKKGPKTDKQNDTNNDFHICTIYIKLDDIKNTSN